MNKPGFAFAGFCLGMIYQSDGVLVALATLGACIAVYWTTLTLGDRFINWLDRNPDMIAFCGYYSPSSYWGLVNDKRHTMVTCLVFNEPERMCAERSRCRTGEQFRTLDFWLGANGDSIGATSIQEFPVTIAADHYMWGGADMEGH